jgi:hypothetical protein
MPLTTSSTFAQASPGVATNVIHIFNMIKSNRATNTLEVGILRVMLTKLVSHPVKVESMALLLLPEAPVPLQFWRYLALEIT